MCNKSIVSKYDFWKDGGIRHKASPGNHHDVIIRKYYFFISIFPIFPVMSILIGKGIVADIIYNTCFFIYAFTSCRNFSDNLNARKFYYQMKKQ